VALHDCDVDGIARRHQSRILDDFRGTQNLRFFDGDHIVDDVQGHTEPRPDGFPPVDGSVPVENFVQHLNVGYEALSPCYQALKDDLCLCFVRVCGSDQTHRDVGIDEDQPW